MPLAFHKDTEAFLKDKTASVEDVHHLQLIELCKKENIPVYDVADIELSKLREFEQENNLQLPISFREWLLFPQSRLWVMKLTDRTLTISEVNSFELYEQKEDKVLGFCIDDIGYAEWGLLLNGSEDPPVLTKFNEEYETTWYEASPSFSQFIYDAITEQKIVFPPVN